MTNTHNPNGGWEEPKETEMNGVTVFLSKNHKCEHSVMCPMGCSTCWDILLQKARQDEAERIAREIEGMKGILWHDNLQEYTRRIVRHNTIDEILTSLARRPHNNEEV